MDRAALADRLESLAALLRGAAEYLDIARDASPEIVIRCVSSARATVDIVLSQLNQVDVAAHVAALPTGRGGTTVKRVSFE